MCITSERIPSEGASGATMSRPFSTAEQPAWPEAFATPWLSGLRSPSLPEWPAQHNAAQLQHRLPHQDKHSAENCKPQARIPFEQLYLLLLQIVWGARVIPACRANLEIVLHKRLPGRRVPEPGPIGARPQTELANVSHAFHHRTDFESSGAGCK